MPRDQVFISYSHEDKEWLARLQINLKPHLRAGSISSWSDEQIAPGSEWFGEIKSALAQTRVAVLLVTPDFLASDFIYEHELGPLLREAEQGGVKVLWIPVRDSAYKQTPLKNYQAILSPKTPLAAMTKAKRDQAWVKICEEIEKAVNPSLGSPLEGPHGEAKYRILSMSPPWAKTTMTRKTQQQAAFGFGVVFIAAMLALAIAFPNPTPFRFTVFRIVLALATGGVAAMIPGFIEFQVSGWIRAGGALAVFVLVYFYNPASLVVHKGERSERADGQQLVGVGNIQAGRDVVVNQRPQNADAILEVTHVDFTDDAEFDVKVRNLGDVDLIINKITITKLKALPIGVRPILRPTAKYHLPVDDIPEGLSKSIDVSHVVPAHSADRFLIALSTTHVYKLKVSFEYNKGESASFEKNTWLSDEVIHREFGHVD